MVYGAAGALSAEKSWDLRRRKHAAGSLTFRSFNAGVLLLDLDRMRRDDFSRHAIPLVENYAMNDQDALNVYARFNRIELSVDWNAVPNQDPTDSAKILHFAGSIKPWDPLYVTGRRLYDAFRDKWLVRRATRLTQ
jgi:lipopolysaccharide biosynthesis glycosyltransferase